jgi:hypothetical protein
MVYVSNALAYSAAVSITGVKSVIVQDLSFLSFSLFFYLFTKEEEGAGAGWGESEGGKGI